MHIQCLGVNHKNTSVALREKLAFSELRAKTALARFGCGDKNDQTKIQELVILSTCNRVEVYATSITECFDSLENFLSDISEVPVTEFQPFTYRLLDREAAAHIMHVAAGLDSLVLGEPQILGQVTEALSIARSQNTAGKILSRLFQSAIHAGKRARNETEISHNPASIASVAVQSVSNILPSIQSCNLAVIGAGEMAELTLQALIKRGVTSITIVNRTHEKAKNLAVGLDTTAKTFEALPEILVEADVLISSTGAPHLIIPYQMVELAAAKRNGNPLVIMDIAVPRDVDPQIADIPGISLFDIDQLSSNLEKSLAKRKKEVPEVKKILDEELEKFMFFLGSLDVVPVIIQLREQAHQIRKQEFKRTMQKMPSLSANEKEKIDALTKSIVNKILHPPTSNLHSAANKSSEVDIADITRKLFNLGQEPENF